MRLWERDFDQPDTFGALHNRLVQRFVRSEDGTITTFALMVFIMMVAVAGIAIDIMRYETQRVQLQYTLDRAVLAAAAVAQPLNPVEVVENYFDISGLDNYRLNVDLEEGVNWRRVNAYAELEINTIFMHMFGIRVLTSPAEGAAEERIRNVEVSLVLDISGSMDGDRNTNMRAAAREFVTTILEPNRDDLGNLVSVSIIPYNGMVNVGSTLAPHFNLSSEHNASNCARFSSDHFTRTDLSTTEEIERIAHYDHDNYNTNAAYSAPLCPTGDYGAILPFEHDEDVLHTYIDSLGAQGWTAIDLGVNWAAALLDPAARPAIDALVADGTLHPDYAGRPANFDDDETIKVIVVMTDGANTRQYDVRQAYKRGASPVYYNEDDDRYSVYMSTRPAGLEYWVYTNGPGNSSGFWDDEPWGGDASEAISWPALWASYTGEYIAEEFLRVPSNQASDNTLVDMINSRAGEEIYANTAQSDPNTRAICDAANANDRGVVVFAIGFEAPAGGQALMQYCASSAAHYYDVSGVAISDAFASIASAINGLRLIQ